MHKNNISIQFRFSKVLLGCFHEDGEVLRRDCFRSGMESVVELLGYLEKVVITFDNVPAGINAELFQEGHHTAQNLGNSAADESRVDVLNDLARELGCYQP